MTNFKDRLRQERERLGLNRGEFAAIAGVTGGSQTHYESGARYPDASYLAAIDAAGVDVLYVVTGKLSSGKPLSDDENELLSNYRRLDLRGKAGVLGMMNGLRSVEEQPARGITIQGSTGDVSHITGDVSIGSIKKTMHIGSGIKKKPRSTD